MGVKIIYEHKSLKPKDPDKDCEIKFIIKEHLYDEFYHKCVKEYKTISEVVRELIVKYVKDK